MKAYWFACFAAVVFADGFITSFMLQFPGMFAEANPIMRLAIEHSPLGLHTPKLACLIGILLFWKRVTEKVLAVCCVAMCLVVLNNCFWLHYCATLR
jgi:hypothetical protein